MFFKSKKNKKDRLYFDYAAGTPIDGEVLSLVSFHFESSFANPNSLHKEALEAKEILESGRMDISDIISSHKDEIVFTSGGTESDVLALKGVVSHVLSKKDFEGKPHIIISAIEHSAIFDTAHQLLEEGIIELSVIPVDKAGRILMSSLKDLIKKTTVLVSVMYVNNEIGVIQDITAISKEVRRLKKKLHGERIAPYPLVHTDASQAFGVVPVGVSSLGVDLMSFNSGKIYGPKGIGALFVKRGTPIDSIFYKGAQEGGLRPGTESIPLVVGFAKALQISEKIKQEEVARLKNLRDYFIGKLVLLKEKKFLVDLGFEYIVNGDSEYSAPHILHLSFKGLESDQLVIELDAKGVSVSAKSACKTFDPQVSHVLSAIGYTDNTWGSIRFSFGRETSVEEIDRVVLILENVLQKLLHTKKEFNL